MSWTKAHRTLADTDFEATLIAGLLRGNAGQVAETLRPDDFLIADHAKVFAEILRRHEQGEPISAGLVAESTGVDRVGLSQLEAAAVVSGTALVGYAERVRELGLRRSVFHAHRAAMEQAGDPTIPISDLEAGLVHEVDRLHERAGMNGNRIRSAADILSVEGETGFLLPPILPHGLTILSAPPKQGKSFLALGVAVAVALGGYGLGCLRAKQANVLYLALEDNEARLKERLRGVLAGSECPQGLSFVLEWPRLSNGGLSALRAQIRRDALGLVIVDTFEIVRPQGKAHQGVYADEYAAWRLLKSLADREGIAIIGVHHDNKAETEDEIQRVGGSHAVTGAADTVWSLRRKRGSSNASLTVTGRDVERETFTLRFSDGGYVIGR